MNKLLMLEAFPAYAGMNLQGLVSGRRQNGVPRVCGDEPIADAYCMHYGVAFPAYAGMNRVL